MNIFQRLFKKEVESIETDFNQQVNIIKHQIDNFNKTKDKLNQLLTYPRIKIVTKELKRLNFRISNESQRLGCINFHYGAERLRIELDIASLTQEFDNFLNELEKVFIEYKESK